MTKKESSEFDKILDYIRDHLGISSDILNTDVRTLYENYSIDLPLHPDVVLEENESIYFIDIKSKATIDTIAKMNLLRDLWMQNENTRKTSALRICNFQCYYLIFICLLRSHCQLQQRCFAMAEDLFLCCRWVWTFQYLHPQLGMA